MVALGKSSCDCRYMCSTVHAAGHAWDEVPKSNKPILYHWNSLSVWFANLVQASECLVICRCSQKLQVITADVVTQICNCRLEWLRNDRLSMRQITPIYLQRFLSACLPFLLGLILCCRGVQMQRLCHLHLLICVYVSAFNSQKRASLQGGDRFDSDRESVKGWGVGGKKKERSTLIFKAPSDKETL